MAKKVEIPVFEIRERKPLKGSVQHGANTIVFLDGKPLAGVTSISFSIEAGGIAKVQLELIARLKS